MMSAKGLGLGGRDVMVCQKLYFDIKCSMLRLIFRIHKIREGGVWTSNAYILSNDKLFQLNKFINNF